MRQSELSLESCTVIFEKMMRRAEESSIGKAENTMFNLKKWKVVNV